LIADFEVEKFAELKYQATIIKISQFFRVKNSLLAFMLMISKDMQPSLDKT
jgi:hypothetical protein